MEPVKHYRVRHKVKRWNVRRETIALGIFALLVVLGPLAFGAVDRLTQIGLVLLLALGVAVYPPAVATPTPRANALIIGAVAILLFKEFAPAAWFGSTFWRRTLAESFGVAFPWTHNPEPARALDALLVAVLALIWFLWVRMLASNRDHRPPMIWSMFASAAIASGVSFATRGLEPHAIFGLRYTLGWVGFGPFPNRNHSASFLAMGLVLGAGCVAWAAVRKKFPIMAAGIVLLGLVLAAMLATQSRGGLVVAAVGLAIFFGMALLKFRTHRAVGIALGASFMLAAVALTFGAQVIARFTSKEGGEVSNLMRVRIWGDAFQMWKDAPILGHGLESFTQVFPMYQRIDTGGAIVLHPESSWMQWLVELGLLPVLFGTVALAFVVVPRVRETFSAHRTIFLRAAAFGAVGAFFVHSLFDVPGHRWGTAGFALAALAVTCASALPGCSLVPTRRAALVPLAIAVFWALPFLWEVPAWSPSSVQRLISRDQSAASVTTAELQRALRYFPLNPALNQAIGMHELAQPRAARPDVWQRHFHIVTRLTPGAWEVAADQARACMRASPGIALHYWQIAVERAGHRASEVFGIAMSETARLSGAALAWQQYADNHPELLLTYAQFVTEKASRTAYGRWWEERGSKVTALTDGEVESFYRFLGKWGTREQFDIWRQLHPEFKTRDFKAWAGLLHGWKDDTEAWKVLMHEIAEPAYTNIPMRSERERLALGWKNDPRNFSNARDYAALLTSLGELPLAREVVVTVAQRADAPEWFVRKGAHLLAAEGQFRGAVEICLAERKPAQAPAP